ncbi:hypothetical protein N7532_009219 [Penicillium argentinense]|uniref:PCI domain-containing protein n=1 Tax=Penicillium argentinense TaxID=1131581 RepID=A0A9W9EZ56_9EURO|nr:uncharacterized protein N7532_009219 [Penicillium argentinense]KAJ5090535.1 hypothetical protein N7532_009219 [Penicillium argentinense]
MNSSIPPWRATASAPSEMTTPVLPNTALTPAYIPVQARRSLAHPTQHHNTATQPAPTGYGYAQPPPPPPPTAAPESRSRTGFTPAVRRYVQRCFAPENQVSSVDSKEMQEKLRSVITAAAEDNRMHLIDWDRMILPQVMIQNERNKILANPDVSNWGSSGQFSTTTDASRKRKSTNVDKTDLPPWRQANQGNRTEDRSTYPSTEKRARMTTDDSSKSKANLEMRKKRFEGTVNSTTPTTPTTPAEPQPAIGPVIGRCETLEKNYFRLTAPPNPDTKWKQQGNYTYICDQFKSLRQDLVVQHIENDFTVNVYELHARIALEKGDLGEYNQCQTRLRRLYAQKLGGHPTEFKAYRILYFIYTRNWTAINDTLAEITAEDKKNAAVSHALEVRSALAMGNYHRFFQLYLDTPNMGAYLMDMFVDRERLSALAAMCKAYKLGLELRFITEELGFESDEQAARFILGNCPVEALEEKNGSVRLVTEKAANSIERGKAEAFRVVDIKGQI